jgi:hypothetical protein
MAVVTIDIPDAVAPRVAAAFIATFGGNPDATPAQQRAFVKEILIRHIRAIVATHEATVAADATRLAVHSAAEAEINPT